MNRKINSLDDVRSRDDLYKLKRMGRLTRKQMLAKAARMIDSDFSKGKSLFSNYREILSD